MHQVTIYKYHAYTTEQFDNIICSFQATTAILIPRLMRTVDINYINSDLCWKISLWEFP